MKLNFTELNQGNENKLILHDNMLHTACGLQPDAYGSSRNPVISRPCAPVVHKSSPSWRLLLFNCFLILSMMLGMSDVAWGQKKITFDVGSVSPSGAATQNSNTKQWTWYVPATTTKVKVSGVGGGGGGGNATATANSSKTFAVAAAGGGGGGAYDYKLVTVTYNKPFALYVAQEVANATNGETSWAKYDGGANNVMQANGGVKGANASATNNFVNGDGGAKGSKVNEGSDGVKGDDGTSNRTTNHSNLIWTEYKWTAIGGKGGNSGSGGVGSSGANASAIGYSTNGDTGNGSAISTGGKYGGGGGGGAASAWSRYGGTQSTSRIGGGGAQGRVWIEYITAEVTSVTHTCAGTNGGKIVIEVSEVASAMPAVLTVSCDKTIPDPATNYNHDTKTAKYTYSNVVPGTYTFTFTHNSGCEAKVTVKVKGWTSVSAPESITKNTTGDLCPGSNVTFTAVGGTGNVGDVVWSTTACPQPQFIEDFHTVSSNYTLSDCDYSVNEDGDLVFKNTHYVSDTYKGDAMIHMYNLGTYDPSKYKYFQIRYKVTSGTPGIAQVFFTNATHDQSDLSEDRSASGTLTADGNWHILTLDFSNKPEWSSGGDITGWRFDPSSGYNSTIVIDYIALTNIPGGNVKETFSLSNLTSGTSSNT